MLFAQGLNWPASPDLDTQTPTESSVAVLSMR